MAHIVLRREVLQSSTDTSSAQGLHAHLAILTVEENNNTLPNLPALRRLGSLADVRPTVIVDTREQTPLPFHRLPSTRGTLYSGDYSFAGAESLFAIERKTIADLVGCCVGDGRTRFFNELHRLRGFRFKRLLVVGRIEDIQAGKYRSNVKPQSVLATLSVIEARFDVPVVLVPTPQIAGRRVESWAYWFGRELVEQVNDISRAAVAIAKAGGQTKPSSS